MRRVSGPSRRSLLAAWRLGRKLAQRERRLRPILREAIHFSRYEDFRLAHRSVIENSRLFSPWEQRIQKLAEAEGYRLGFNLDRTSRIWDDFFSYVFTPIKNAFWIGWEEARQLEAMYRQKRTSFAQGGKALTTAADVFHVAEAPPTLPETSPDELSEEDRWDAIAEKLFDDLQGDKNDQLWDMPEAVTAGAKAKVRQP
jgi:hypothetical protein